MFKKAPQVKAAAAIRSSDKKKLKAQVATSLWKQEAEGKEKMLDDLFGDTPVAAGKFVAHGGDAGKLYSVDGQPLFVELENLLFPTVYTLWKIPGLLPSITTHQQLFDKLLNGADLMLPGVVVPPEGLPELNVGDLVSIVMRGQGVPVGVGRMLLSTASIKKSGMVGKGVSILHMYKDTLWLLGSKEDPPKSDSGFVAGDDSDDNDADDHDDADENQAKSSLASSTAVDKGKSPEQVGLSNEESGVEKLSISDEVRNVDENTHSENGAGDSKAEVQEPPRGNDAPNSDVSQEDMERYFQLACMGALVQSLKDSDLPITASTFYSAHMLPQRPAKTSLDIKKTSFKKLSKFLSKMEKLGVMKTKDIRGEPNIMSVDRKHELYVQFKPFATASSEEKKAKASGEAHAESAGSVGDSAITVTDVFRATGSVLDFVSQFGVGKDDYLTVEEIKKIVADYVQNNSLVDAKNQRMVNLDATLLDVLFKKSERDSAPNQMRRDAIQERLANLCQPGHIIKLPGKDAVLKKGALKPVQLLIEARQGRKTVTRVSGLEAFGIEPDEFAEEMRKICAASTSVAPLVGKANAAPLFEVLIQGHVVDEVADALVNKCAVPKRFIEVMDKTKK